MPTWSPDSMRAAASSALMILCARLEFKTRGVVGETIVAMHEAPSIENELFALTVPAPLSPVCELGHGGRNIFKRWAQSDMTFVVLASPWNTNPHNSASWALFRGIPHLYGWRTAEAAFRSPPKSVCRGGYAGLLVNRSGGTAFVAYRTGQWASGR